MTEAKESFRISNNFLPTSPLPNFRKLVASQALSDLLGTPILVLVPGFLFPIL